MSYDNVLSRVSSSILCIDINLSSILISKTSKHGAFLSLRFDIFLKGLLSFRVVWCIELPSSFYIFIVFIGIEFLQIYY